MRRALWGVAALAAMLWLPPAARSGELTAATAEQAGAVTTAVYQPNEEVSNVRPVDYRYGYRYGSPYYRYGYRYPTYNYGYGYYRPYDGYRRYPQYGYGYPRYGTGYRYGYPDYRYGARPGVSFGFRF